MTTIQPDPTPTLGVEPAKASTRFRIFTPDAHKALPANPDTTKPEGPGLNGIIRPLTERITHPLTSGIRDYVPPSEGLSIDFDGHRPHHGAASRAADDFKQNCVTRSRHEVLLSVRLTKCKGGVVSLGWEGVILRQHFGSAYCVHSAPGQPPVRSSVHDGVIVCTRVKQVTTEDIVRRCADNRILCVVNRKFRQCWAHSLGKGVCPEAPDREVVSITVEVARKRYVTFDLGLVPGAEQPWTF
ncbi:MAG: hypothetical protein ACO29V_05980 [Limnohabitans sp.]